MKIHVRTKGKSGWYQHQTPLDTNKALRDHYRAFGDGTWEQISNNPYNYNYVCRHYLRRHGIDIAVNGQPVSSSIMGEVMATRNKLYQMLAIEKNKASMDEDCYREILRRHGAKLVDGKYSAKTMSERGLNAALFEIRRKNGEKTDWRTPRINKIRALWHTLADSGIVRENTETAMQHWCKSVCGVERLNFANAEGLNKCIEGLKAWCDREGVARQ